MAAESVPSPSPSVLMCRPENFDVSYEINAFMEGNCGLVDFDLAQRQWAKLLSAVQIAGASVELVTPQPGLPDLVFTANGGFIWGSSVVLPRFAHAERRGEEPYFREWFSKQGYTAEEVPGDEFFEGEGDVVVLDNLIFLGCHSRTSCGAANTLERVTGLEVIPLRLNPRGFYHIDTCMFTDTASRNVFYAPEAFTSEDRKKIVDRVGQSRSIEVSLEEAQCFACNTVVIGDTAISPLAPTSFADKVEAKGLRSVMVDLSEFMKAGGAAKCLVLRLA